MKTLLLLSAIVALSFTRAKAFDEDFYYYLSTTFEGDERTLDIVNDGQANNQPILANKEDVSGQLWRLTPVEGGFYRLTTLWRGQGYSLDIVNDGKNNNQPILADTGEFSGQLWSITLVDEDYYRLTTAWRGENYSLDVYNDNGRKSKFLILAPTKEVSGQHWRFSKSDISTK